MKSAPENIISLIKKQGVIPLFYHDDAQESISVVNALYNAGIRIVEYTNRGSKAIDNFKALLQTRDKQWQDLLLGAGTIKTTEAANGFINAGADFIICPCVIPEVAKAVHEKNLLWIPGCITSTEITIAEQHGAKLIKIFPGSLLGASYIKALKEIFPDLLFMPTGGVDISEENFSEWFNAGVSAVGLGSKLISKEVLEKKDYKAIEQAAAKALALVEKINVTLLK